MERWREHPLVCLCIHAMVPARPLLCVGRRLPSPALSLASPLLSQTGGSPLRPPPPYLSSPLHPPTQVAHNFFTQNPPRFKLFKGR